MKSIWVFGLVTAAILAGCDLQNAGNKIDLSGCWQVIDTTMGEALFAVDTGSLELAQSGQAINGYVSWSKSDFDPPDSVAGTLVGNSLTLKVTDLKTKVIRDFGGVAKDESSFAASWSGPQSIPFTTPTSDWAGVRISCRTGK
ncbi:MAG: hypothetical protein JF616_09785 [Fibrobacteres bacterium]|nr:hypothetical protein [Fibrobacterota bacterium]